MQSDWETYLDAYNNATDDVKRIIDSELIPSFSQDLIQKSNLPPQKQRDLTMFTSELFLNLKNISDAPDALDQIFGLDAEKISSLTIEIKNFVESKPTPPAPENTETVSIPIGAPPVANPESNDVQRQNIYSVTDDAMPTSPPLPTETTDQVRVNLPTEPTELPQNTVPNPQTSVAPPNTEPPPVSPAQNELNTALNTAQAPAPNSAQSAIDVALDSMSASPINASTPAKPVSVPVPTPDSVSPTQFNDSVQAVEEPHTKDGGLEKIHGYGAYRDIHPDAPSVEETGSETTVQATSQEATLGNRPELAKMPMYTDSENDQGINQ